MPIVVASQKLALHSEGGGNVGCPPHTLSAVPIMAFPDPSFSSLLSRYPQKVRTEVEVLFATKHLAAVGTWQQAWKMVAGFCIELEDIAKQNDVPKLFEEMIRHIGPGPGELKEMMRALTYCEDPRFAQIVQGKISPKQINGAVDEWLRNQTEMNIDGMAKYAVQTSVQDLSFDTIGTDDVLLVSPTTAGAMGEDTIKSTLDRLGIDYIEQYRDAYMCDFGELKRPDFKVGAVKSQGDARLSNGFYIESTTRLTEKNKDVGLFYLLHQVAQYSDLPTIVVYDGPVLSDRVWDWARGFRKKHEKDNRLFEVCTYQQFREWMLRKLGSQVK
jgi:hypothetical protein